MNTDTLSRFFASLALFTFAATIVVIALAVARRIQPDSRAGAVLDDVALP